MIYFSSDLIFQSHEQPLEWVVIDLWLITHSKDLSISREWQPLMLKTVSTYSETASDDRSKYWTFIWSTCFSFYRHPFAASMEMGPISIFGGKYHPTFSRSHCESIKIPETKTKNCNPLMPRLPTMKGHASIFNIVIQTVLSIGIFSHVICFHLSPQYASTSPISESVCIGVIIMKNKPLIQAVACSKLRAISIPTVRSHLSSLSSISIRFIKYS